MAHTSHIVPFESNDLVYKPQPRFFCPKLKQKGAAYTRVFTVIHFGLISNINLTFFHFFARLNRTFSLIKAKSRTSATKIVLNMIDFDPFCEVDRAC